MTRREVRLRSLFLLTTAASVLIAATIAFLAVRQTVAGRLDGVTTPEVQADVVRAAGIAVVVASALALSLALLVTARFGTTTAAAFARLRRETARLAEGGRSLAWSPAAVAEANALATAVTRLAQSAAERSSALAAQHGELAQLMNAVSEGIVQIGGDGRIQHANRAAQRLLRLPPAPRGQRVATVVRSAELRQRLARLIEGAEMPPFELQLDERRILVSAHPLASYDATDSADGGAVFVLVDLTELRRLEDVRRDFVANASHELKTPLTSIRGYAETLLTDDLPAEMRRQFLETIHANAERLHRVVDDLLDLSRIESGRWQPQPEPLALAPAVEEAWAACRDAAARRHVELQVDDAGAVLLADRFALGQVLANLLDNAVRYARENTTIRVSARQPSDPGRLVWIEVRDEGAGIPRDALPRVFERFYRVDPGRAREAGGTGLGLAIVKHLVESMGGEVIAESELGRGTTVRFSLPAAV